MQIIVTTCLVTIFGIISYSTIKIKADDPQGRDEIGRSTSQLVKLRQFHAINYNVSIAPGVKLQLVRIINPLFTIDNKDNSSERIKTRRPILFIHGIISSSNYFLVNSIDARPRDLRHLNTREKSEAELIRLLNDDPSSKSLPLLMSNLGSDVWLLNRRPTLAAQYASALSYTENSAALGLVQSLFNSLYDMLPNIFSGSGKMIKFGFDYSGKYVNANLLHPMNKLFSRVAKTTQNYLNYEVIITKPSRSSANHKNHVRHNYDRENEPGRRAIFNNYWNFSLDDQALIDLPIVIDFILSHSPNSKKVSTVSHSTGGALMLMALSTLPKLHEKIDKVALWAPAMDIGRSKDDNILIRTITRLEPVLRSFEGPVEPSSFAGLTELTLVGFCQTGQLTGEMCNSMTDAFDGIGSDQLFNPIAFSMACGDISGSHELAQLIQSMIKGRMYRFDYGSDARNTQIYGQPVVERYNTTRIKMKGVSIWQGNTDALVTTADTQELMKNIGTPVDYRYIDGPGLKFDHSAFMLHKNVSSLINIPTAKFLEQD